MANSFQEQIFFHYILNNQLFLNVTKSDFFTNINVKELFEIAKEHAIKYKEPPSKEQMIQLISIKGLSEKYTDDMISSLYNTKLLLAEYDSEWLENNVGPWIQVRNLDNVMRKAIAYMKTTKVTAENASEVVEKIRHMLSSETAIDFTFNLGSDFFDSASHLQTKLARTPTGYDFIDLCAGGGYWKGSLIVLLGAPKSGKCIEKNTYITIKNKKTGEIKRITIEEFYNNINNKKSKRNVSQLDKKFTKILNVNEWEVETEEGWKDIVAIGKTVEYEVYEIKLDNGLLLRCADTHIIIKYENLKYKECFIKDLKINDILITKNGFNKVISVENLKYSEEMYDLEINSNNHTYFTNNILSHNTSWACNLAAKSVLMGHNTAYITLELQRELVNKRIGANLLNVPISEYDKLTEDQPLLKQKLKNLKAKSIKPLGEFHVKEFPASTASSNDVEAYLLKAQELLGYKFHNIFIDYVNIMKNWRNPNTENTYMKIKQICEDVRAMGQRNNWAIISVTQTNRSGWLTNDIKITDIAESGALLQTVDMLFGIITDPVMKAKGEYFLKCLANRVEGYENCKKRYTMDWKYLRIEEDKLSPIHDMDFVINSAVAGQIHPRGGKTTTATIDAVISSSVSPVQNIPDNIPIKNANITGNELF